MSSVLPPVKDRSRGNALFLILIAVALFAALSYAITQSSRGGGTVTRETGLIAAAQATQFMSTVRTAVTRMVLLGAPPNGIGFNHPASGSNDVFSPNGGGVNYAALPPNIGNATDWGFVDINHPTNGEYIRNVGTNTNVSGRDVFGGIADVTLQVCTAINKELGLSNPPAVNSKITGYAATYSVGNNVIDAYPGSPFGCINPDNENVYVYYHALIER